MLFPMYTMPGIRGGVITPPVFRSTAGLVSPDSAASITVTKPTGTAEEDVLIATIVKRASNNDDITWPSGFAQIATIASALLRICVGIKTAGNSEPANYTFTPAATAKLAATIDCWSNVDTADRINQIATNTGTSATPTAPSIVTDKVQTAICYLVGWVSTDAPTGTPGINLLHNVVSDGTGSANLRNRGDYKISESMAISGTGNYTIPNSRQWTAVTLALNGRAT